MRLGKVDGDAIRVCNGFAHVVNNLYQERTPNAIGGRVNPSTTYLLHQNLETKRSQGGKETHGNFLLLKMSSKTELLSKKTGSGKANLQYNEEQKFQAADARSERPLTSSSSAFKCSRRLRLFNLILTSWFV
ncbi:hypothetical protein WN943_015243 [Citrus x changshan-huyou]